MKGHALSFLCLPSVLFLRKINSPRGQHKKAETSAAHRRRDRSRDRSRRHGRLLPAGLLPRPPDSLEWFFVFTCSCPAPLHRHRLNRIVARSQANTPPRLLAVSQKGGLISPAFAYVLRGISKGTVREMALLNTDAI